MSYLVGAFCLGGILTDNRAQRPAYEYCHLIRFAKDPKICHFMVRNGEKEGPFSWCSCLFTSDLF